VLLVHANQDDKDISYISTLKTTNDNNDICFFFCLHILDDTIQRSQKFR
jgi:hypothetical protein